MEDCLLEREKKLFDGTFQNQDVIDVAWTYEAYWSLRCGSGKTTWIGVADFIGRRLE